MKVVAILYGLVLMVTSSLGYGCDINNEKMKLWAKKIFQDSSEKSIRETCKQMNAIDEVVGAVQNTFSEIASNTISYKDKIGTDGLIENTIQQYFVDASATVQVYHSYTNIHSTPDEYDIRTYLNALANLTYKGTYVTVNLEFDLDSMQLISAIPQDDGESYLFEMRAFQLFTGCKSYDNGTCYEDATDKRFFVLVTNIKSNKPQIRLHHITAKDAWARNYFDRRREQLLNRN